MNGGPLILTPFIKAGRIEEAKRAALVKLDARGPKVISYSGYLTVDPVHNGNLFFWFFPAMVSLDIPTTDMHLIAFHF